MQASWQSILLVPRLNWKRCSWFWRKIQDPRTSKNQPARGMFAVSALLKFVRTSLPFATPPSVVKLTSLTVTSAANSTAFKHSTQYCLRNTYTPHSYLYLNIQNTRDSVSLASFIDDRLSPSVCIQVFFFINK